MQLNISKVYVLEKDVWHMQFCTVVSILIQRQALQEADSSLFITTFGGLLMYLLYKENSNSRVEMSERRLEPICHISVNILKLSGLTQSYI